jgi:hypothetical protein
MDYNIRRPGALSRPSHQSANAAIILVALVLILLVADVVFAWARQAQGGADGPDGAQRAFVASQVLGAGTPGR